MIQKVFVYLRCIDGIFGAFGCFRLKILGQLEHGAYFLQLATMKSSPSISCEVTHFRKYVALF